MLAVGLGLTAGRALSAEAGLMRHPDIHGGRIVFVLENDLWTVPAAGGQAVRLTTHPGVETLPKFSPDGRWIAFTGSYDGGDDVYVIPSSGGEPRRLTFHPERDEVVEWFPDGKSILASSPRAVLRGAWRVPFAGGLQEPLPVDRVRHASFEPGGRRVAFTRSDADEMNWRGYKGGAQPDLWLSDNRFSSFEKCTEYRGFDIFPMWHASGVYFLSDRDGPMALYALTPADRSVARKAAAPEGDLEQASIGGDAVVAVCRGRLWVYDIPAGTLAPLRVEVPSDRWLMRETEADPSESVQDLSPSCTGDTVLAQSRGDVYWLDSRAAKNLTEAPDSEERAPALSPDGRRVAFFSDRGGSVDLYVLSPDRPSAWTRVTEGFHAWPYTPHWSPDSRQIAFCDNRYRIFTVDLEARSRKTVDSTRYQRDNEIFWEVDELDWSPDSRWIAYSKCGENLNSSIFLYSLGTGKVTRLTDDRYDDTWPAFSADGRLLYFLSRRNFDPELDPFMDNHVNARMSRILAAALRDGEKPPFARADGETAGAEGEPKEAGPEGARGAFRIDLDGLERRIFDAPAPAGTYSRLRACEGGVCFLSRESYGFPDWSEFLRPRSATAYSLMRFDREGRRVEDVLHGLGYFQVTGNGRKAATLSGSAAGVVALEGESAPGDGALDWRGLRHALDARREYGQMLRAAWNQVRLFFYDPAMHGVDWPRALRDAEDMLPYVSDRSDLDRLIGRMIGTLGASHAYILDEGDRSRIPEDRSQATGLLGADLAPDPSGSGLRFERIVAGRNWDEALRNPLEAPDAAVRAGEYLLAVDGRPLEPHDDVYAFLAGKAGREVRLTVNARPDTSGARAVTVRTLRSERGLRHAEWAERNYRFVREASKGRAGYLHLSDMDDSGFREFEQGFRSERYRDALIVDVRGNGGGFIAWFLADKLERRPAFMTRTRGFAPMRYPHGVHAGPLVFLCDGDTGSDGEVFVELVKKYGLGPVIGTDTWGGLVGIINMIPLADGALVSQPNVGFYDPDTGAWLVENRGARPDRRVENGPGDAAAGRDPQLEAAVRAAMELLESKKDAAAVPPAFPKR